MKCHKCGLVNFNGQTVCKRCGTLLQDSLQQASSELHGAWRDSTLLVLGANSHLPRQCIKCNSDDGLRQKTMSLGYGPEATLALLPLGIVYSRTISLTVSLCHRDRSSRRTSIILSVLLLVGGVLAMVVGAMNPGVVLLVGGVMLVAGALLFTLRGDPISVHRVEKRYIWIEGANKDYLAGLPLWSNRQESII